MHTRFEVSREGLATVSSAGTGHTEIDNKVMHWRGLCHVRRGLRLMQAGHAVSFVPALRWTAQ